MQNFTQLITQKSSYEKVSFREGVQNIKIYHARIDVLYHIKFITQNEGHKHVFQSSRKVTSDFVFFFAVEKRRYAAMHFRSFGRHEQSGDAMVGRCNSM